MSTRDNICLWHADELMNVEVTVSISYDMFPLSPLSLSFTFVRLRLNFKHCARREQEKLVIIVVVLQVQGQ